MLSGYRFLWVQVIFDLPVTTQKDRKGSVKNVIGLIRRTYPKKTDWNLISQSDLDTIQFRLNHRPKKCLNFLSPAEAFSVALDA